MRDKLAGRSVDRPGTAGSGVAAAPDGPLSPPTPWSQRRWPVWLAYMVGTGLLVVAVAMPWAVRWLGIPRGELPPGPTRRELRPVMMLLPAGEFVMGSPEGENARYGDEGPQHRVSVSAFEICQTEVTVAQYEAVTGKKPSDCDYGCEPDMPVHDVTWFDAIDYLDRLTALENSALPRKDHLTSCYKREGATVQWIPGCTGYRLPTEAEWEYAARAGSAAAYSFGDDEAELGDHAWYEANAGGKVHRVGTAAKKDEHPWGLYDMHGNAWEWVWDWYAPYRESSGIVRDPRGPGDDDPALEELVGEPARVLRGGGLADVAWDLRSADRDWSGPALAVRNVGFRCARGVPRAIDPSSPRALHRATFHHSVSRSGMTSRYGSHRAQRDRRKMTK